MKIAGATRPLGGNNAEGVDGATFGVNPSTLRGFASKSVDELGPGQYHLAVAGGSTIPDSKQ